MAGKNYVEEKVARGGKIRTETGVDHSSHQLNHKESMLGRTMKGGPTDLSHSLNAGSYNSKGGGGGR
jgi:hypothetical protein